MSLKASLLPVWRADLPRVTGAPHEPICSGMNVGHVGHAGQFLRTRQGTIVIVYLDFDGYKFSWDNSKKPQ